MILFIICGTWELSLFSFIRRGTEVSCLCGRKPFMELEILSNKPSSVLQMGIKMNLELKPRLPRLVHVRFPCWRHLLRGPWSETGLALPEPLGTAEVLEFSLRFWQPQTVSQSYHQLHFSFLLLSEGSPRDSSQTGLLKVCEELPCACPKYFMKS